MVGNAGAKGKVKSTTSAGPVEKAKGMKRKGVAPKINLPAMSDGGGDNEQKAVAKRSTKGMRPGTGVESPAKMWDAVSDMRNAGKSFKTLMPRNEKSDAGSLIDEWCNGKRKGYK
jgi:hypothetical protein